MYFSFTAVVGSRYVLKLLFTKFISVSSISQRIILDTLFRSIKRYTYNYRYIELLTKHKSDGKFTWEKEIGEHAFYYKWVKHKNYNKPWIEQCFQFTKSDRLFLQLAFRIFDFLQSYSTTGPTRYNLYSTGPRKNSLELIDKYK
jgi:hypothetical protein